MGSPFTVFVGFSCLLIVGALLHCLSANDEDVRLLPKPAWILIILLLPSLGAFAYLVGGRRMDGAAPRRPIRVPRKGSLKQVPARPVAPDDNPEFLAELSRRQRRRESSGEQT